MGISIDAHELVAEANRDADIVTRFRKLVFAIERKVGSDTEREWKQENPVDSGRSRASVGHWTDGISQGRHGAASKANAALAGAGDTIYEESETTLTVVIGSNVDYMEILNQGHSQQAPAGFIDLIADKAGRTLETAIAAAADAL